MDDGGPKLPAWIRAGAEEFGSIPLFASEVQRLLDDEMERIRVVAAGVELAVVNTPVNKDLLAQWAKDVVRRANAVGGRAYPLADPRVWAAAICLEPLVAGETARSIVEHMDARCRALRNRTPRAPVQAPANPLIVGFEDELAKKMKELLREQEPEALTHELVAEVVRISSSPMLLERALDEAYDHPSPRTVSQRHGARKPQVMQINGGNQATYPDGDAAGVLSPPTLVDALNTMAGHAQTLDADRTACRSLRRGFVAAMIFARHDSNRNVTALTGRLRKIR